MYVFERSGWPQRIAMKEVLIFITPNLPHFQLKHIYIYTHAHSEEKRKDILKYHYERNLAWLKRSWLPV